MSQVKNLRFDYTLCKEGGNNYFVLINKDGSPVAASDDKDEIIKKASELDDDKMWVAALPKGGSILNIPPEALKK